MSQHNNIAVRRTVEKQCGNRHQGIEPSARLVDRFGDEIGGELLGEAAQSALGGAAGGALIGGISTGIGAAQDVRQGRIAPRADLMANAQLSAAVEQAGQMGQAAQAAAAQTQQAQSQTRQTQPLTQQEAGPQQTALDGAAVIASLNPEETLFILVSKSGVTQETLANELFVKSFLKKAGLDPAKHMIAVTSETSPLANNPAYLASFYMDDFIGGRFSSSSAVGGAVISLAFGPEVFACFLSGAAESDKMALETDIRKNAALLDALIGVYERNVLGFPATAVLPYSQALSRFPAHLQQADMESNGKQVNRFGEPLSYATGPVVFGEPGTNGQHSFYQLLHQGTDIIPLQFIGFLENQTGEDVEVDGSTSQMKLRANLAAQIVAFAKGKDDENPNKRFPGERPSSLISGKQLTPEVLGALLAHFENKIMFQGFTWNVNSFDQEGVQLGKKLTKNVLAGDMDETLAAYAGILGL